MAKEIYLADDDEGLREILPDILEDFSKSYELRIFENADLLCEQLSNGGKSDLAAVVTDYNTKSDYTGLDVLNEFARNQRYQYIPFILMSANLDDESLRQKAMNAGAFDCLKKPFKNEELISMLERALNSNHQ